MDKSKNNRKNYGTAYFATAFLASFFFEFYWIMTDPYNHFMLFGTGFIMIIMGYLTIDSLLKTKADNDAIKNEQSEMMLKAQKAIYIATKKSSKEVAKAQVQNLKAMELMMNQMISSQRALLEEKNSDSNDINALIDQLQESNTKLAKEVQSAITVNQLVKANADLVKNVRDALSANAMTYEQTADLGAYVSAAVGNPSPTPMPQANIASAVEEPPIASSVSVMAETITEARNDNLDTLDTIINDTSDVNTNRFESSINDIFSDDFMDKAVAQTATQVLDTDELDLDSLLSETNTDNNDLPNDVSIDFGDLEVSDDTSVEDTDDNSSIELGDLEVSDDTSVEDTDDNSSIELGDLETVGDTNDVTTDNDSSTDFDSLETGDDDSSTELTDLEADDDARDEDTDNDSTPIVFDNLETVDDTNGEAIVDDSTIDDYDSLTEISTDAINDIDLPIDNVSDLLINSEQNDLDTLDETLDEALNETLDGIDETLFTNNTSDDIISDVSVNFADDTMSTIENEINMDEMERSEALEDITIPDEMTTELDEAMTEGNPEEIMNEVIEDEVNTDDSTTTLPPDLASGNIPNRQLSDEEIAALFASL